MPLVLVQNSVIVNDGYDWKDIEGERYHFPNQYRNRCLAGTPFVYYRGTRRPGGKRAEPEYFGYGRIGEVWRDVSIPEERPKKDWAWFCTVVDYVPFPNPVPAKTGGEFIEKIARNHWSVGVRPLPQDAYDQILQLAGLTDGLVEVPVSLPTLPVVNVVEADHPLLLPRKPSAAGVSRLASITVLKINILM